MLLPALPVLAGRHRPRSSPSTAAHARRCRFDGVARQAVLGLKFRNRRGRRQASSAALMVRRLLRRREASPARRASTSSRGRRRARRRSSPSAASIRPSCSPAPSPGSSGCPAGGCCTAAHGGRADGSRAGHGARSHGPSFRGSLAATPDCGCCWSTTWSPPADPARRPIGACSLPASPQVRASPRPPPSIGPQRGPVASPRSAARAAPLDPSPGAGLSCNPA